MANRGFDDLDGDGKAGAGLLAALLLGGIGAVAASSSKKNRKEKLQQELQEINHQLSVEKSKGWFFRDNDKIAKLEERKKQIIAQLK